MARFNEILVGRYNRFLQKLLSIKGGPPSPQLASEIMPVFQIEGNVPVDTRTLLGWDRFARAFGGATGAGATQFRMRNPKGSNVIVVLEKLMMTSPTAGAFAIKLNQLNTDLTGTGIGSGFPLDTRKGLATTGAGTLIFSGENDIASVGNLIYSVNTGVTSALDYILSHNAEIPILPGSSVNVEANPAAGFFTINLVWRERLLEESELNVG